jgi:peptidoglycan/LPS O-acetylase OafA/YrhL
MPSASQLQADRAAVPTPSGRALAPSRAVPRIPALDFTKGVLVLIMVLYHWINYFIGPQWGYYEYLRFLTPSFIFISGFMISHVYLSKYSVSDARLPRRLSSRGLKLLGIFVVLNLSRLIIIPALGTAVIEKSEFGPWALFAIFVSGNLPVSGSKLVSFSILVPISYLLLLSGTMMYPMRAFRHSFHVVCALLLLAILVLDLMGMQSLTLEFVAVGMMGVLTGFMSITSVSKFVQHPLAVGLAYAIYLVAITKWNVPFPLLVPGVVLSLMVIYYVGAIGKKIGPIKRTAILLGKYSLFGYIAQIGILQILSASSHRLHLGMTAYGISFLAAFAFTIASVELADYTRTRIAGVDWMYRAVFA